MATSGSTDFTQTQNEIISDAYRILNVYGADETVSAEDYSFASKMLNRIIKSWQAQGLHLWKKSTATIFLQKDQRVYDLHFAGAHAAESYVETTLSADEAIGQTTISVASSAGMSASDYVAIENDNNALQWSTISNVPDSTSIIINDPLVVAASENDKVYTYTTRLSEPFNVYSAVRESESAIDTPMNYLSYEEYFSLPNKTSASTPVSYNYDRQLGYARISVWPVPQNVEYLMKITLAKKIEDFDSVANTPDFPQEWLSALTWGLATKLAPSFGKGESNSYMIIKQEADAALAEVASFDNEQGSVYLQPDLDGSGGYGRG